MKRSLTAFVALAALLAAAGTAHATYLPQERIPTDSPVYRDLERLEIRYRVAPRFMSSRPLRIVEALAYLRGLAAEHPDAANDPAYTGAIQYLDPDATGATRPLVSVRGSGDEEAADSGTERLEISPYAQFLYAEDPRSTPDINRDYRVGAAVAGALDTSAVFVADFYEGTASQGGRGTPDFGDFNSLVQGVDFNSYVKEAYVEFPVSKLRFLFGHTWLKWGPGETGTLALSDAAPALDMLRYELGMFRRFRFNQFVAMLDPGAETYLAGHRLEWQATPALTVGATEMARFNGTSQAGLYLIPFVPYSFWEKRPKSAGGLPDDSTGTLFTKNNVLWAADASWVVRPGWRLYGEFLLDDYSFSTDYKPDMFGYQAGVDLRRPVSAGALGALIEYTRIHNYVYSAWHGHDFAYDGFPTGYVLGPDVQEVSGLVSLEWGSWEFHVVGEYRKKGEGTVGDAWDPDMGEVD
ncbi:MAG: capsule assembly Wzi family protein, partial [Candidatus Eiseniibacteriota bacterium]